MIWLPTVLSFGILALCCAAFWLCRRERKTIKQMIDDVVGRPADKAPEPRRRPY